VVLVMKHGVVEHGMLTATLEGLVGWQQPVPAGGCHSGARVSCSFRPGVESDERSHAAVAVEMRAEGPGWI
jgi:hypothetical protein